MENLETELKAAQEAQEKQAEHVRNMKKNANVNKEELEKEIKKLTALKQDVEEKVFLPCYHSNAFS